MESNQPISVIYAGGTIGMVPQHRDDPDSPLVPGTWDQLVQWMPQLDRFSLPIQAVSVTRPVDSSDMSADQWIEIAGLIREHYDQAAGFVVLHGTDTMSYTATALAFMLQGLSKPVVVTGSQLPITAARTDAIQNFVAALSIAAGPHYQLPTVPEVCLFFGGQLFRGCRTTKVSADSFDAFASPNYPPLGHAGTDIHIQTDLVRPPGRELTTKQVLSRGVIAIRLSPGLDPAVMRAVLEQPEVKGVILETYGAGNAPNDRRLLDALQQAIERGQHIVNVTQCLEGRVEQGRYMGGAALRDIGVISGWDMTTEAATLKLQILLGEHSQDGETIKRLMQTNLVGEQTDGPSPTRTPNRDR